MNTAANTLQTHGWWLASRASGLVAHVAVVIGTAAPEKILEAAESCPAVTISVIDEESGEPVFP